MKQQIKARGEQTYLKSLTQANKQSCWFRVHILPDKTSTMPNVQEDFSPDMVSIYGPQSSHIQLPGFSSRKENYPLQSAMLASVVSRSRNLVLSSPGWELPHAIKHTSPYWVKGTKSLMWKLEVYQQCDCLIWRERRAVLGEEGGIFNTQFL